MEPGGGWSAAAIAAVAPVTLRVPSATATGTLPMQTVPGRKLPIAWGQAESEANR